MPRIDVMTLARELFPTPVPFSATLRVQAWAGDDPFTEVKGPGVTFSPRQEVQFKDGVPDREVHLEPTLGAFCYRWDFAAKPGALSLPTRYTEVPDVDEVEFGDLQAVDPTTFLPVPDVIAAWENVRAETREARDETVAARDSILERTVTATPDPSDPGALILTFPTFMLDPDGSALLMPLEAS